MKKPKLPTETGTVTLVLFSIIFGLSLVCAYETLRLAFSKHDSYDNNNYRRFLTSLRNEIPVQGQAHGIPILHAENILHESKHFIEVELISRAGKSVTLGISVVDLSLVGFRLPGSAAYFSPDSKPYAKRYLFKDAEYRSMTAIGSFEKLEKAAGQTRKSLECSLQGLADAIDSLALRPNESKQQALSMLTFSLLICDALRFADRALRSSFQTMRSYAKLTDLQIERLNNWRSISTSILAALENGVFPSPIEILNVTYGYVNDIVQNLGFLLATCNQRKEAHLELKISSVPGVCSRLTGPVITSIVGLDGNCVDVKDYRYENGNPVIIYGCHGGENQLWSLESDGTIRCTGACQGKCLATFKDSQTAPMFVIIADCSDPTLSANHWEVNADSGEIMNLETGLFLTAKLWAEGELDKVTQQRKFTLWNGAVEMDQALNEQLLAVEPKNCTLSQGWDITNPANTAAKVSTIVTATNRCLKKEQDSNSIEKAECNDALDEKWSFFADGSIRPDDDTNLCLTCDETDETSKVLLEACDRAVGCKRWEVKPDGTIRKFQTEDALTFKAGTSTETFLGLGSTILSVEIWYTCMQRQPRSDVQISDVRGVDQQAQNTQVVKVNQTVVVGQRPISSASSVIIQQRPALNVAPVYIQQHPAKVFIHHQPAMYGQVLVPASGSITYHHAPAPILGGVLLPHVAVSSLVQD